MTIEPQNVTDGQWQGNLHPLAGWWTTALVAAVFVTAGLLLHVCLPVLATLVGIGWGMVVGIAVFAATYRRSTSGEDVAFFWASIAVIAVSAAVVWAVGLCGLLFAATSFASMLLTLAVRQLNIDMPWI